MRQLIIVSAALMALVACSDGSTVEEVEGEKGQIGSSSGPNPNFGGEAASDAYQEPTFSEQGIGPDPEASKGDGAIDAQRESAQGDEPQQ